MRRGVTLMNTVAGLAVVFAAEEVVEPDFIQARRGTRRSAMCPRLPSPARLPRETHHGGVPPDVGPDPALDVLIAREPGLALGRDRVDVVVLRRPARRPAARERASSSLSIT